MTLKPCVYCTYILYCEDTEQFVCDGVQLLRRERSTFAIVANRLVFFFSHQKISEILRAKMGATSAPLV